MIVPVFITSIETGAPLAGVAATFAYLKRHNPDGTVDALPSPTIEDRDGGAYDFELDDELLPDGAQIDYVIDATPAAAARYLEGHLGELVPSAGAVSDFFVYALAGGALLTTAAPSFVYYQRREADGSMTDLLSDAPTIVHRGAGLYGFAVPSVTLPVDTSIRFVIDLGTDSAARYLYGNVDADESTATPQVGAIVYSGNDWADLLDGLRAWVKRSTGLSDGNVIWADQTGPRPSSPFASLRIGPLVSIGPVDEVVDLYDAGRDAGQEIELRAQGVRRFTVSVQMFTPGVLDTTSAHALLTRAQLALALPSIRDALADAGVTVFSLGTVQNISALKDVKFEGRALLEIGCYTLLQVSEFTTYIETVEPESFLGPPDSGTTEEIDIP